jgi:DNA-binding NarL/FixJ family response regulator
MERFNIRVIIVDDHRIFRIGLRAEIKRMTIPVTIVGEAASGVELFELLKTTNADIVLLDIRLPDMSGIDIARELREEYPDLKILILSAEADKNTIGNLMVIGINGFISKSAPPGELEKAIDYIDDGAEFYGRDIASIVHCVRAANKDVSYDFTPREREIIKYCAQGWSAKQIAHHLDICLKTVVTHKYNIFRKMGITNNVELVNFALRTGIINL